jgi:predicted NAD-dependent protein-ADP-ribosyltransferase YbiA (DUF1768 family)
MDIGSGRGYPASALSNFSPHPFVLDGVACASMEGFLQSLKFDKLPIQEEVCKLVGKAAKFRGKKKKWYQRQVLFWRGVPYNRHGQPYQDLLDRAYKAMFDQSESFRKALKATQNAVLTHSIGKSNSSETILTEKEFCSRLMSLRRLL